MHGSDNYAMKKINLLKDVLPHVLAVVLFFLVTVLFFNPLFFDNKTLDQHDIKQWQGGAQQLNEYRQETGKEGLWATSQFSGMPAYFVNLQWNDGIISGFKYVLSLWLPHPVKNIFLAFLSFYILLLVFKVRPYLAIGGALAFGLSSFIIIGLSAGHNARIGATAFMPMVLAGVHLVFKGNRWLGFGLTSLGLSLQLRENHPQVTYYLALILGIYGLVMLYESFKEKDLKNFGLKSGILVLSAILSVGTYAGRLWSAAEYSQYSMRGKSEISNTLEKGENESGLKRDYAFEFSNSIFEPLTLILPNVYGGSSSNFLAQDEDSKVLAALQRAGDPQVANQLVRYTSAYWGNQRLSAPYYVGAIICFLFVIGILFADKKYKVWLVTVAVLGIMLSWGDNFKSFNYFIFDHLPGYNKFRSVTFALTLTLIAMPLLGMIGLEKLFSTRWSKELQKKLLVAFGVTGGFCLLAVLFAGVAAFSKEGESQLPLWFLEALIEDRKSLLRADAIRSFIFIFLAFVLIFGHLKQKVSFTLTSLGLSLLILIDLWTIDVRYFGKDNYRRKSDKSFFVTTEADQVILKDKSEFRVYNLRSAWSEARTSYHHNSLGGYHGAKMRRYQDLYDHCLQNETTQLIQGLQQGNSDLSSFGIINMLNTKYITFGDAQNAVITNNHTLGSAWLVKTIKQVNSPTEELQTTCQLDTRAQAVVDISKFEISGERYNDEGEIKLIEARPDYLKYTYSGPEKAFALFSEIYYPIGWKATVDGKAEDILRANYVLRALELPGGQHTIEFTFQPESYYTGNTITYISCILLLIAVLGSIGYNIKIHYTQNDTDN